jgi:hypothetical protein
MMLDAIWPKGNGADQPLPAPNVVVARAGTPPDQLSPEAVKGILVNPIYTGVGPFPRPSARGGQPGADRSRHAGPQDTVALPSLHPAQAGITLP